MCVYRHSVKHSEAEKARIIPEITKDPTLPRTRNAWFGGG